MKQFTITGELVFNNDNNIHWLRYVEANNFAEAQQKAVDLVRAQHKGDGIKSIEASNKQFELMSFNPNNLNWQFRVLHNGETKQIELKEKAHWPVLLHQSISLVEEWLTKNYLDLIQLAFGYMPMPPIKRIEVKF